MSCVCQPEQRFDMQGKCQGFSLSSVACRVSTAGLLMLLCKTYPNIFILFLSLLMLDLFSHWFQMYSTLVAGSVTHKVLPSCTYSYVTNSEAPCVCFPAYQCECSGCDYHLHVMSVHMILLAGKSSACKAMLDHCNVHYAGPWPALYHSKYRNLTLCCVKTGCANFAVSAGCAQP